MNATVKSLAATRERATPWWDALPEDFRLTAFTAPVGRNQHWKVKSTAAVDVGLRTATASLVGLAMTSHMARTGLAREFELTAFHRECVDNRPREDIFPQPPPVAIEERDAPWRAYHPENIPHRVLRFTSPHVALDPALRADYARHERSHRTVAQYWYHPDRPRKTLLFLHGFFADNYWFNSMMFSLRWFWQQGWDIVLMTLPFHGVRRAPLDPFSGFGMFAHGVAHFNETMLQAVCDTRVLIDWLTARGAPSVGISGLSMGGYLAAMTASVDSRLAFCIPNSCMVSPADMLLEWAPISWAGTPLLRRNKLSIRDVRHALAIHCPLTWTPRLPPERLLLIGGAGDRVVTPRHIDLLHRHWQGSALHWFPGNHIVHLHQSAYLRKMRDFMQHAVTH